MPTRKLKKYAVRIRNADGIVTKVHEFNPTETGFADSLDLWIKWYGTHGAEGMTVEREAVFEDEPVMS